MLLCALSRIQNVMAADRGDRQQYDFQETWPYDTERHVLERVARLVAQAKAAENHREMWEPVFALGTDGSHWITAFISHWLLESAGHDVPAPNFLAQWTDMLAYAEQSAAWKGQGRHYNDRRDLWEYLLGFVPFGRDFWHEKLSFALEGAREYHERWACAHVDSNWDACNYVRFLRSSAAKCLRVNGLKILHNKAPLSDQHFWSVNTQDAFAAFLHHLQEENWSEICRDTVAQAAFMAFALRLASLQHRLGSEMLVVVGSRLKEKS